MDNKYHEPRVGDPVTLSLDARMRPSRAASGLVSGERGELLTVLGVTGPRGAHGVTVEVLTPRGETGWIWASYLDPAR